MKIAIIGAGWLGCHVAYKLKRELHDVTIFDKTDIFAGSSFFNQNRLHKGFHYSRNQKTRKLCYDTFDSFINDYPDLVDDIENNFYVIPTGKSLIDYGTFKSIFFHEEIPFIESNLSCLRNIDGSVIVNEKYIDPIKSKNFFKQCLSENLIISEISSTDINRLSKEYDFVINVTNNVLQPFNDCYFELSLTLIYDRLVSTEFGSITMIDGPLFSIYPYSGSKYTVTDVEYTPLYTSDTITDIKQYQETINKVMISNIRSKIEDKIQYYYGGFKTHFEYSSYYTSIKVKRRSESADRYPIITKKDNVINCVTGKIQGIYTLENFIKNEIINR
jgi:hypothetical protein